MRVREMSSQEDKIQDAITEVNPDVMEHTWLPSQFVGYDTNMVYVRRLKVKEVKLLSKVATSPSLSTFVRVYRDVVSGIDVADMYPVDFKFIMFVVAQLTKSDFAIHGVYNCTNPECEYHKDKQITGTFKLEDIDWEEMPQDLPITVQGVDLRPLRVRDIQFLDSHSSEITSEIPEFSVDIGYLALMSDYTISDNNSFMLFKEVYDKISECDWDVGFDDALITLYPDVKPIQVECPGCKSKFGVDFDLDYSRIYL